MQKTTDLQLFIQNSKSISELKFLYVIKKRNFNEMIVSLDASFDKLINETKNQIYQMNVLVATLQRVIKNGYNATEAKEHINKANPILQKAKNTLAELELQKLINKKNLEDESQQIKDMIINRIMELDGTNEASNYLAKFRLS